MFGVITLFGCGMLTTGRSPVVNVSNSVDEVTEAKDNESVKEVRNHVSAFTAEDLYRSRAEKITRNRRRAARVQQETASLEDAFPNKPVSKKNIVEIIQIIDDTGIVVASKKVK